MVEILSILQPSHIVFLILLLPTIILVVLTISQILKSNKSKGEKIFWVTVVILLPILGALLFYISS